MSEKVRILNVGIDKVTMKQALNKLLKFLKTDKCHLVYTPNPEFIMEAQKNKQFLQILNKGDLVIPDGIGVVIGSKILKKPLPERVAGYDLVQNLLSSIKNTDYNVFFWGAAPNIAEIAAKKMREKHKGINIVGTQNGYFKDSEIEGIINRINELNTDVLLIGLGAPKQEMLMEKYQSKINAKICIGVGGTFDGMSGKVKRAPVFFQKLGLEWFYRLIKQPTRAKRMLLLPKFLLKVISTKE